MLFRSFAHQHALDLLSVGQFHQQFLGAISGDLVPDELAGEELEVVSELFTEWGRQVGHLVDRLDPATVAQPPDLRGAVGGPLGLDRKSVAWGRRGEWGGQRGGSEPHEEQSVSGEGGRGVEERGGSRKRI